MKREIKFRAWDKENKKLYFCDYLQFAIGGIRFLTLINDKQNVVDLKNNGYELMQFTGLKDKNGKEIYEGDILQNDKGEKSPIIFDGGCFGLDIKRKNGDRWFMPLNNTGSLLNKSVIGNIYENPELL